MKRSMILAACLCLCLSHLSGCAQQEEAPDTLQQSAPSQNQPVEPIPEQPEQPAPVEEVPAEPEEPAEPPYEFPSGVWLAKNDVGYTNYYTFDPGGMTSCSLDYGMIVSYSYEGSEGGLTFTPVAYDNHGGLHHNVPGSYPAEYLPDPESTISATIEEVSDDEIILHWENDLTETLTLVQDNGEEPDEFPTFFCNAELASMAIDHYAQTVPYEDLMGMTGSSMTNVDNTVTVQLYENLGDHNSTAAWYIVDRFTATGTDLLSGEEIDLLEHTQEEPAEDQPTGDTETPTGEEILPGTEEPSTEDEDVIFAVPET